MAKRTTPWTNHVMNPCDVQEQLDAYVTMVQEKVNWYWERMKFTHSAPPVITATYGNKYVRIVQEDADRNGQRFVHSFVNMKNGDILKAGGWKAPAPNGIRSNIFADDCADHVNEHGTIYLRR